MCQEQKQQSYFNLSIGIAAVAGLCCGFLGSGMFKPLATIISDIFLNLLKLVSLPIIFLSIVSTASSMESLDEVKLIGRRVIRYTFLTTIIAATIALALFVVVDPARVSYVEGTEATHMSFQDYSNHLLSIIPSNFIEPFQNNNVIGVLFLAILLSFAILSIQKEKRQTLNTFFSSIYTAIMKITTWIIGIIPIAIWAFVVLFVDDLRNGLQISSLALYLMCVMTANLLQGFVVLPILLKWKGISPLETSRGMFPALSVAFFSKSSSAALPTAMKCGENNLGISSKVARFSFPLCTTINMNGCAGFILITVLFVSMSNGMAFSPIELITWIGIATIAAVGNAGVPMGCYFMASAFLAAMNVPLNIMGAILPFYALIDMLETAINVWSDSCVSAIVDKEVTELEAAVLQPVSQ